MNSPLGKYGQVVAAGTATAIIAAYLVALLFGNALGIETSAVQSLKEFALIAGGAVFGGAAAVNGVKGSIAAAHDRLDKINAPSAATAAPPQSQLRGG